MVLALAPFSEGQYQKPCGREEALPSYYTEVTNVNNTNIFSGLRQRGGKNNIPAGWRGSRVGSRQILPAVIEITPGAGEGEADPSPDTNGFLSDYQHVHVSEDPIIGTDKDFLRREADAKVN